MPDERVVQEEAPGLGLLGPRSRHLLALEFGSKAQVDDPRLEWRRPHARGRGRCTGGMRNQKGTG
jgi:hypothetical protein